MLQSMPTTTWNGGQSMVNTCQGMAGDDGRMSRNSRRTMDILLGTMGTTLGDDDGSMANIAGTT